MATAGTGRPKESCSWNYFKYLEEENKSVCLVVKHNEEECSRILNVKFSTNLRGHLKKEDPLKYVELEESEKVRKQKKSERSPSSKWTVMQNSYR